MEFNFKNYANKNIKLTAYKLVDLIELDAEAKWEIKNDYTLIVETPKYIGYHMGKIEENSTGDYILSVATANNHSSKNYFFEEVYRIKNKSKGTFFENLINNTTPFIEYYSR